MIIIRSLLSFMLKELQGLVSEYICLAVYVKFYNHSCGSIVWKIINEFNHDNLELSLKVLLDFIQLSSWK